jgi:hypothetical protein
MVATVMLPRRAYITHPLKSGCGNISGTLRALRLFMITARTGRRRGARSGAFIEVGNAIAAIVAS